MTLKQAQQAQLEQWQSMGYLPPAKQILEFNRMLIGNDNPRIVLDGIKVTVGRLYYNARQDDLWVFEREDSMPNRPRVSLSDLPQWLFLNNGMARGDMKTPPMPLFKYYYDAYHGSSSLQSSPLDFPERGSL